MSNFSTAKPHKAEVAKKVDLPACPDMAKRPRGIKKAQSHFLISVLQKQTPMLLYCCRTNDVQSDKVLR